MDLENSKSRHVKAKLAITSTIALLGASVGINQQVQADELVSDNSSNIANEGALTMPTTLEEASSSLSEAKTTLNEQTKELDSVNVAIVDQKDEVATAETAVNSSQATLDQAQENLTTVSELSQEEFAAKVEESKATLAATDSQLQEAKAAQTLAQEQVAHRAEVVSTASDESKKLASQVAEAQKEVTNIKAVIDQPETISSQAAEAKIDLATVTKDLANATSNLTNVTTTTKTKLSNELSSTQASLNQKQAELSKLQSSVATVPVNIAGSNTMVATANYPIAEIKKLISSGYIGSQSFMNTMYALRDTIIAKTQTGALINNYVDIASDLNRFVDPNNLSTAVQDELALFASQMINSVRKELNLAPVVVTRGSQEFAKILTTSYKATHGNTIPNFTYGVPDNHGHYGVGPHDRTIIEASASSVGLVRNDDNMYENIGFFNDVPTVNGIKRSIYNSLKYMLFTDYLHGNIFGHTVNLLRSDKVNPSAPVYLGFSTETVGGGLNTHFVIFPESNIRDYSRFNKTIVTGPTKVTINSSQIQAVKTSIATLTSQVNSLKTRLASISSEPLVMSAQNKVKSLQIQYQFAMSESVKLDAQLQQLTLSKANLKQELLAAQANASTLKAKLDKSLVILANAKVTLHKLEEKASSISSTVATLTAKKVELTKLLDMKLNPERINLASKEVEAAQRRLEATIADLAVKKSELAKLVSVKTRLQSVISLTNQRIDLLNKSIQTLGTITPKTEDKVERLATTQPTPTSPVVDDVLANTNAQPTPDTTNTESPEIEVEKSVESPKPSIPVVSDIVTTIEDVIAPKVEEVIASKTEEVETSDAAKTDKAEVLVEQTAKAVISSATALATTESSQVVKQFVTVAPQVLAGQGVVGQVTNNVTKSTQSTSKTYGTSTTTGNQSVSNDESTKRAIQAGVVMLSAVGLTGLKLRKDKF